MIDLTRRQGVEEMRMLPQDEYLAASRAMGKALRGTKGNTIKAVEVDGALRILIKIDEWWYYPHAERGWRAPEMTHPHHTTNTERR